MTKRHENQGRARARLALRVCLGALPLFLAGGTGCQSAKSPAGSDRPAAGSETENVGLAGSPAPGGSADSAGAAGAPATTESPGPAGQADAWTLYRGIRFDYGRSELPDVERLKVNEVARYLSKDPSLEVGLDGSLDPLGSDPRNQDLSDRRVGVIRDALIEAGVPAASIRTGSLRDSKHARDRQVALLLRTVP